MWDNRRKIWLAVAIVVVVAGVLSVVLFNQDRDPATEDNNQATDDEERFEQLEEENQMETFILSKAMAKFPPRGNPLVSHKFGADPYALVFEGRVYLYMTADSFEYDADGEVKDNTYGKINTLNVISSDDLRNWTDHGAIPVAGPQGAAKWATQSWAPAIAHKVIDGKDKFFLYFANNASHIGVLTSDSPTGPWIDPIGKPLITRDTPGVAGVHWLFDPAVLVDDDGRAYIYFGGGVPEGKHEKPDTARVMELGADMISVLDKAVVIESPFMFENNGIHKYNGLYYYTYCSNFYSGARPEGSPGGGEIAYMVSDNPMGPWEYKGTILRNPSVFFGVGGNNHHAVFEWGDKWYIAYHAQTVSKAMGVAKGYRSTHLNEVLYEEDGSIKPIVANYDGVEQIKSFDLFVRNKAVTFAWNAGIQTADAEGSLVLTDIHSGDWIGISRADFGDRGAATFSANVQPVEGGSLELHLDRPDGPLVGTLNVAGSGWMALETEVSGAAGVHDLFLVFKGKSESELFQMSEWQFIKY